MLPETHLHRAARAGRAAGLRVQEKKAAHLLVQGDLCQVQCHLLRQVGLPGANGCGPSKGEIIVESGAVHAPGVKQAFQALHIDEEVHDVPVRKVVARRAANCGTTVPFSWTKQESL